MKHAVRDAWFEFNVGLEGWVDHFYADVKGLITIGMGNLVDPVVYATQLPMRRADDTLATKDDIITDWFTVSRACCGDYRDPRKCAWSGTGKTCMAHRGFKAAAKVVKLHLPEADIKRLVHRKLDQMAVHLNARFKDLDDYPADCQMGIFSMAWAAGPAFRFPLFEAHLRARDFHACVQECGLREDNNPGVVDRNKHNRTLFQNAARVVKDGLDPDVLYWPKDLENDKPTLPDLSKADPPEEPCIHDSSTFRLDDPALDMPDPPSMRSAILDAVLEDFRRRQKGG